MSRSKRAPTTYKDPSSDEDDFEEEEKTVKKRTLPNQKLNETKKKVPKIVAKNKKQAKEESDVDKESDDESDLDSGNDSNDDDDDSNEDDDSASDGDSSNADDDDEEEEDDDDDDPPVKKQKKTPAPKKKASKPAPKKSKANNKKSSSKTKKKASKLKKKSSSSKKENEGNSMTKAKKLSKLERLEEARKAYKWWEAKELPAGINWRKLEHPGVLFTPPYIKHGIPIKYDGKEIVLTPEQEEIATFYAAIPDDGPQLGNPKTRGVFQRNFFEDFKKTLPPGHEIKKFELCDFSLMKSHILMERDLRKAATDEEKKAKKEARDLISLKHSYALIDGRMEKMGNYNMEPPGLFRGRGEHPLTGKLKQRCFSESVKINVSEDSCPPICNLPGHAWGSVQHDPMVTWLCDWQENVQDQHKYVMLAASSSFKGKSDTEKYTKAIKLKSCISKIRADYTKKMKSKVKPYIYF